MEKDYINRVVLMLATEVGKENISIKKGHKDGGYDCLLCVNNIDFRVKYIESLTVSNFALIVQGLRDMVEENVLLVSKSISTAIMKEFANRGINTIDMSGNCNISAKGLIIKIEGRKSSAKTVVLQNNKNRLFQEAGLKVIFSILSDDAVVNSTYREIKNMTGVSLGSVTIIMNELMRSGFILSTENGKFLKQRDELLQRWLAGYAEVLKPKYFQCRMTFKDERTKREWSEIVLPEGSSWGGEPAAYLYDGYLQPKDFVIYGGTKSELVRAGLRPDDNGEISVYNKFFISEEEKGNVTPKFLVYAELMISGNSRNIEAAQRLLENEQ